MVLEYDTYIEYIIAQVDEFCGSFLRSVDGALVGADKWVLHRYHAYD